MGPGAKNRGVIDAQAAPNGAWELTEATARNLALWMTFEDTLRVADLKTRSDRSHPGVREEVRAAPGQLVGFPREFHEARVIEEIAGTATCGTGGDGCRASPRRVPLADVRWTGGKQVRTNTVCGFLMLHALAGMKRWRAGQLEIRAGNAVRNRAVAGADRRFFFGPQSKLCAGGGILRARKDWSRDMARPTNEAGEASLRWWRNSMCWRSVLTEPRFWPDCRGPRSRTKKVRRSEKELASAQRASSAAQ